MKAHLGGTHKNVAPCCQVPQEVRHEIKEYVEQFETAKFQYQRDFEERVDAGAYFTTGGSGTGSVSVESSASVQKGPTQQSMLRFLNPEVDNEEGPKEEVKMTPVVAKEQRNRVCLDIGRFFFRMESLLMLQQVLHLLACSDRLVTMVED
ncbi:hypothetical protein Hanom_Chr00s000098g01620181 [Helianthus anomalus]